MAETTLTLNAETGQAEARLQRVSAGIRNIEQRTRLAARASREHGAAIRDLGQHTGGLARLLPMLGRAVVPAAAMAGLAALVRQVGRTFGEIADRRAEFESALTPVLSIGDKVRQIDEVRAGMLNLTTVTRLSLKELAESWAAVEAAGGRVHDLLRRDILPASLQLSRATGGDVRTAVNLVINTLQAYGDELGTVGAVADRVFHLHRAGVQSITEQEAEMSKLLPTARALGHSFDDVAAALAVVTQEGGRSERVTRGFRDMLHSLSQAADAGQVPTGRLVDQLRFLNTLDRSTLTQLFSREAFVVAASLAHNVERVNRELRTLENLSTGLAERHILQRALDPGFRWAEAAASARRGAEDVRLEPGMEGPQRFTTAWNLTLRGVRRRIPEPIGRMGIGGFDVDRLATAAAMFRHVALPREIRARLGRFGGGPSILDEELLTQAHRMTRAGQAHEGVGLLRSFRLAPGDAQAGLQAVLTQQDAARAALEANTAAVREQNEMMRRTWAGPGAPSVAAGGYRFPGDEAAAGIRRPTPNRLRASQAAPE